MSEHKQKPDAQQRILRALTEARTKLEQAEARRSEPIAIVGLGCRFPGGVRDADSYWDLLANGVDAMAEVPGDRWDLDHYYDPDPDQPGKMYAREAGFIDGVGDFDPDFFRITRREAQSLDPQQRLLLEVVWNAFEDAGQSAERIRGSDTGFFMGLSWHDYERNVFGMNPDRLDAYAGMGNTPSIAVGRLAFVFGAHGPTMQVDTACSASLVAVHLACQSLRIGETRMAAAGGVNLMISPLSTIFCCKIKALSADGRCKTFDASADGYARGEGCGVVVLKRLSHAIEDGDNIRAVIRGTAINHDGPASGLTVPNRRAQQRVIEAALANGRVDPLDVSYVEAHGTGTTLGDPIEIGALGDALGRDRPADRPLRVGAVKTNFGHLEAAAGIAGLIKTVVSLERGQIPPHLHFTEPSPEIDWDAFPISVPTELKPWDDQPRIGSVSSFGFSGTNAHVVLEEAPAGEAEKEAQAERGVQVLCLSGKTEGARRELAEAYAGLLPRSEAPLGDICHTAHAGRAHFEERVAVVGENGEELAEKLTRYVEEGSCPGVTAGRAGRPKVGFLFTGQGSQWVGMGRELYESQVVFREEMDRCAVLLEGQLERPLLEVMYGGEGELLGETAYTQPALFALEWSLAQMWRSWGVEPSVVMGHSVGEYVAACVAGVFSLEEGLRLISARGRLMQALPKDGSMVAVLAEEGVVAEALKGHEAEVSMAAVNGPTSVVISGSVEAVNAVVSELEGSGVKCKALEVSHAFHSPLMDPMLDAFEEVAKDISYAAPKLAMVSNVTGEMATDEVASASYWRDHVRSPVRFAAGMAALHGKETDVYLEVGPSPVLVGMGQGCVPEESGAWLTSLRKGKPAWPQIQQTLAELYVQGVQIDWQGYDRGYRRRKVSLPTYPFQRKRFWVEPEAYGPAVGMGTHVSTTHPLLGDRLSSPLLGTGEALFESHIAADSPGYLQDHRLFDTVVPPATVYYEMALAAGSEVLEVTQLALENVEIHQPLLLTGPEPRTLQCLLRPDSGGGLTFEVFSLAPEGLQWVLHASGGISPVVDTVGPSVDALGDETPNQISGPSCYERFRTQGLDLGPSFQALQGLDVQQGSARGRTVLPDELQLVARSHHIHPVLLDACGQAASLAYPEGDEEHLYLPVGVDRIELLEGGCSSGWTRVRTRSDAGAPVRSADAELVDDDGKLVARIIGATTRRARKDAVMRALRPESGDPLYVRDWRPTPLASTTQPFHDSEPGTWLVIGGGMLGNDLARQFESRGQRGVHVGVESFGSALQDLKRQQAGPDGGSARIEGVVFLAGAAGSEREGAPLGLVEVIRTLVGASLDMMPRLSIVTTGAQYVVPGDLERPTAEHPEMERALATAPLWGLGATIALEHPELAPVRIDLDLSGEDALGALMGELGSQTRDDQVAYRAGVRYSARLAKAKGGEPITEATSRPARPVNGAVIHADATYLVTGGLGALGLEVARWLSAQGARHLALMSRRAPDAAAVAQFRELEDSGTRVVALQTDISKRGELDAAFERLAEHPPLRGIVHAAGVLEDGVLMQLDEGQLERAMLPKVAGTRNLHASTAGMALDFFACFSSAASVIGSKGQGNYAAANSFMDAFAYYRRALGLPAVSINWGPWAEVGMAANLDDLGKRRMYQQGWDPIPTESGLDVLGNLLCGEEAQVAVLPVRWGRFLAHNIPGAAPAFFDDFLDEVASEEGSARGSSGAASTHADVAKQVMAAPTAARRGVLTGFLQKQIAEITLNDQLEPEDHDRSFAELGLDSLMQMELRNVINKGFGSNVPMADFVESESVSDLSELLLRHLALADITSDAVPGGDDDLVDITL